MAFTSLISGSLKGSAGQREFARGGEGRDTKEEEESTVAEAGGNAATGTAGEVAFSEGKGAGGMKIMVMSNTKDDEQSSCIKGCSGAAADASIDATDAGACGYFPRAGGAARALPKKQKKEPPPEWHREK